jgi:hypothetical protein
MSFPWGNIVVDPNCDPNKVFLITPRYKMVPVAEKDFVGLREVLDVEETARVSAVITGIGDDDGN